MSRKTNEVSLENSFGSSRRALSLVDVDRRFVRVNRKFAVLLGLPQEEIIGRICHELVHHTPACIEGGRETVLVVEDDEMVRGYMRGALSSGGYTLMEAADGEEAVALLRGGDRPIDLVITDVIMPKMGGKDLNDWLAANRPEVKVLFVSGYVGNERLRERMSDRGERYLQKPFTPEGLLRTVRKAIESDPCRIP